MTIKAEQLRIAIVKSLRKQGYKLREGLILPPEEDKENFRKLHALATNQKVHNAKAHLWRYEDRLLQYFANGDEVDPERVSPRLVVIRPGSQEELLFRYATLHWTIPVSSGYGRRIRFLIVDEQNSKVIGLFGLSDPVYAMSSRDKWIGWNSSSQRKNLYHVMNAHVIGAVPPYSNLLCGKLVSLLLLSNEVRMEFASRYGNKESRIEKITRDPYLALVTTTSAFGRSSIYNRLRINGFDFWKSIGYTQGTGEFHFSNGVYEDIRSFVNENCVPKMKNPAWGDGFRNKREIIRCCLAELNLPQQLLNHGIKREIYAAPLGRMSLEYLRGQVSDPEFYDWSAQDISTKFLDRWLIPRSMRDVTYMSFDRESYRLWPSFKDRNLDSK